MIGVRRFENKKFTLGEIPYFLWPHRHTKIFPMLVSFYRCEIGMKSGWVPATAMRVLIAIPVMLVLLYAGDYAWLRLRMGHSQLGPAFGTVRFYLATPTKSGREEIFFDQPQTETCARSLFPQLAYRPCWYAGGKTIRVVR